MNGNTAKIFTDYINQDCVLDFGRYGNGGTALSLRDPTSYELLAVASVNMQASHLAKTLAPDEMYIKSYSENSGMEQALIEAGVLQPKPTHEIPAGRAVVRSYRLTPGAEVLRRSQESML